MDDVNVWIDEWDAEDDWSGGGAASKALPHSEHMGATLYELDPGDVSALHFHHGSEELLIVLRGTPTLRTPGGERLLDDGACVSFAVGPVGAHGLANETNAPVRYVMVSTLSSPEVVEYPELRKITAQATTPSQTGDRLWLIHDLE
jgi:uncharacterized cupin superfamily protein